MGETSVTSEIRRWKADEISKDFFSRIIGKVNEFDSEIHGLLLQGGKESLLMAAFLNARMQQLKEVLEIPQDMIEDTGEE